MHHFNGSEVQKAPISFPSAVRALVRIPRELIAVMAGGSPIELLEKDPELAIEVLAHLKSSHLPLRRAAVKIGLKKLSQATILVSLENGIYSDSLYSERFQTIARHNLQVAQVNAALCTHLGHQEIFGFMIGLLHDIAPPAYLVARAGDKLTLSQRWLQLCTRAGPATRALARWWRLPASIYEPIISHHENTPQDSKSASILTIADALTTLVARQPEECQFAPPAPSGAVEKAYDILGLSPKMRRSLKPLVRSLLIAPKVRTAAPMAAIRRTRSAAG